MITRLLEHARTHTIAYVALCLSVLALSGGAYAALSVPANSVGARQIRNHAIGPVKLDPATIGGTVRHWARVDSQGKIVSSSSPARDTGVARDGSYLITWSDTFSHRCIPIASVLGRAALLSPAGGFANVQVSGAHPSRVWVHTYDPQGESTPLSFSLAVIC